MTIRSSCRVCENTMHDVMSLGDIVPVDFIKPGDAVRPAAPLTLCACDMCGLVQLRHNLDRDSLFRQYWYLSGLNPTMVAALRSVVDGVHKRVTLQPGDTVVDVGCNDGTLLGMYDADITRIGVDPARNLAETAMAFCDVFVNDYFETTDVLLPPVKALTSIAMFYDLDDPRAFVAKVARVLQPDGVWVMQMTDLVRMLRANAFDNICHEHVCYYSLEIFTRLIEEYGLEVFDVEFNDVNGASVRTYVGHKGAHAVEHTVRMALEDESEYLADDALGRFARMTEAAKTAVVDFVRTERAAGKTIHAMGASTKGNTLLQFFGLTCEDVPVAAEVNESKFGLVMAGCGVPVVSQADSLAAKPDHYLVLPWHFIDFFLHKHEDYLKSGGTIVVPLPIPTQYGLIATGDEYGFLKRRMWDYDDGDD